MTNTYTNKVITYTLHKTIHPYMKTQYIYIYNHTYVYTYVHKDMQTQANTCYAPDPSAPMASMCAIICVVAMPGAVTTASPSCWHSALRLLAARAFG